MIIRCTIVPNQCQMTSPLSQLGQAVCN